MTRVLRLATWQMRTKFGLLNTLILLSAYQAHKTNPASATLLTSSKEIHFTDSMIQIKQPSRNLKPTQKVAKGIFTSIFNHGGQSPEMMPGLIDLVVLQALPISIAPEVL